MTPSFVAMPTCMRTTTMPNAVLLPSSLHLICDGLTNRDFHNGHTIYVGNLLKRRWLFDSESFDSRPFYVGNLLKRR